MAYSLLLIAIYPRTERASRLGRPWYSPGQCAGALPPGQSHLILTRFDYAANCHTVRGGFETRPAPTLGRRPGHAYIWPHHGNLVLLGWLTDGRRTWQCRPEQREGPGVVGSTRPLVELSRPDPGPSLRPPELGQVRGDEDDCIFVDARFGRDCPGPTPSPTANGRG